MNAVVSLTTRRPQAVDAPAAPAAASVPPALDRILRLPAVKARVGLSRTSIYRRILAGTFPASRPLGGHAVGWRESEITRWIAELGEGGEA